jgi:ankyrin repeat protein
MVEKTINSFELNIVNIHKQNLFHICAQNNNSSIVTLLKKIRTKSLLNEIDCFGNAPIHYSIIHNNVLSFKYLCHSDCDLNITDNNGNTPLHLCFKYSNFFFAKYLIDKGVKKNVKNNSNENLDTLIKINKVKLKSITNTKLLENDNYNYLECTNEIVYNICRAVKKYKSDEIEFDVDDFLVQFSVVDNHYSLVNHLEPNNRKPFTYGCMVPNSYFVYFEV